MSLQSMFYNETDLFAEKREQRSGSAIKPKPRINCLTSLLEQNRGRAAGQLDFAAVGGDSGDSGPTAARGC